jgi:signal transduction histidine kinase
VVEALQPSLAAKAHRLAIEMDPRCAEVVNDPSVLKQVAHHLLSNAIKFTPRDGAVTLRVTAQIPDRFRIAVTYAGIGVGAPDLERVFIPFEPLDSSAGVSTDTAGVGLALTKRIAEAQAGRVGVDRLPGAGSVFFAELPTTWPAATA